MVADFAATAISRWRRPAPDRAKPTKYNRAAIVLAGGEGGRLPDLRHFLACNDRRKQSRAVPGSPRWLAETQRRVAGPLPFSRAVVVVNRAQKQFYEPMLNATPRSCVVEQRCDRGTAPAILYGLRRLAHLGRDTIVVIFACDRFIGESPRFMAHVERAIAAIQASPESSVILGVTPMGADACCGWIECAEMVSIAGNRMRRARRFWERPDPELAARLWRQGCLLNSSVMVARAPRVQAMIAECASQLFVEFNVAFAPPQTRIETAIAEALYNRIPKVGFFEDVLASCPPDLVVERVDDVAWNATPQTDYVPGALISTGATSPCRDLPTP